MVKNYGIKITTLKHDQFVVASKMTEEERYARFDKGRGRFPILANDNKKVLYDELFRIARNHVPENTEVDEDGGFRIGISGAGNDYMAWLSAGNDGGEFVIAVRSWQKQGVPEVTRDILLLVAGNEDGMEI